MIFPLQVAAVRLYLHSLTLTLLVPPVNPNEGTECPLSILAIHLISIGSPCLVEGQLQTYEVVTLGGTARLVEF